MSIVLILLKIRLICKWYLVFISVLFSKRRDYLRVLKNVISNGVCEKESEVRCRLGDKTMKIVSDIRN